MDPALDMTLLRWTAAGLTIVAAILVSWGASSRMMVLGFVLFTGASLAWIAAGLMQEKPALTAQNLVLLAINAVGIWRWSAKSRDERTEQRAGASG